VDWIAHAHHRDRVRALVDGIMNIRLYNVRGISGAAEDVVASQEGLCFLKLYKD